MEIIELGTFFLSDEEEEAEDWLAMRLFWPQDSCCDYGYAGR